MTTIKLESNVVRSRHMLLAAFLALTAATSGNASTELPDLDWPRYGGSEEEWHYVPLTQIDTGNVGELGLAWYYDLPVTNSVSAEPMAVDGTIYFASGYSVIHALDAVTGREKWIYDPQVPETAGDKLRVAWGIRGIAFGDGKVVTGTHDGRLIALDAVTGRAVWSVLATEPGDGRYITGAPRVFGDKVIIGHAGADYAPTRGYVAAYDLASGSELWRFFTVPGNPAMGFENDAMRLAAQTWSGEWWKYGGGGTAWNAITYDRKYDRVLIGTGNGLPWNQRIRSPGGGDNLFLCSVVALDAETGDYVWHYQMNPGETWDYNCVMDIQLATLEIDGEPRDIAMQAPKNGFFYVIDRRDGVLISAEKIAKVTWASHIDLATGRPVETENARYVDGPQVIFPFGAGAHNWHAMAFSPETNLVYIPTMEVGALYDDTAYDIDDYQMKDRMQINPGVDFALPPQPVEQRLSSLQAWDPVQQKQVWSVPVPGMANSGVLATGGGLVFQGHADGRFLAYSADNGEALWSYDAGAGITGAPIAFARGGVQYVAVVAGYGGGLTSFGEMSAQFGWDYRTQRRRLLVFRLGGKALLPPGGPLRAQPIADAWQPAADIAAAGRMLYNARCSFCHGGSAIAGGGAPDLRGSYVALDPAIFDQVVRGGLLVPRGMPRYDEFTDRQLLELRSYIRHEANAATAATVAPSGR